ncbi:hypothetical protein TUMEXPCC7403_11615 [Tumidithrix helvetica PCC 7403]
MITPPHAQLQVQEFVNAGKLLIFTVGEPGFQGVVAGTQGMGTKTYVKTPSAAAVAAVVAADVAAATAGLAMELHAPKGGIFAIGAKSMMFAAATPPTITGGPLGITLKEDGAAPKLQVIIAPITTCTAIFFITP